MVAGFLGHGCPGFELYRGEVADRGVAALSVVEDLDVLEHRVGRRSGLAAVDTDPVWRDAAIARRVLAADVSAGRFGSTWRRSVEVDDCIAIGFKKYDST